MPMLLRYSRESGTIVGIWESNNRDLLQAQRVEDDAMYGYLDCALDVAASIVEQDYQVVDGVLMVRPGTREE